ncbi:MAG: nicotinamidase-related amidase [Gammaproteobacteria bacterium]|jgi:nicotinamidase-related amidase
MAMSDALILVDIQNDYFAGGTMELTGMAMACDLARMVLGSFRKHRAPLFHIQHLAVKPDALFFVPNTHGVEHHEATKPNASEVVIQKNFPNAFRGTDLEEQLRAKGIEHLVIVGAMSHMCIDATTRAAFDLGFRCTVVHDACATRDLVFNKQTIPAQQVHASFMAALSAPYASVVSCTKYLMG